MKRFREDIKNINFGSKTKLFLKGFSRRASSLKTPEKKLLSANPDKTALQTEGRMDRQS